MRLDPLEGSTGTTGADLAARPAGVLDRLVVLSIDARARSNAQALDFTVAPG